MTRAAWSTVRLGNHCSKIGSGSTPRGGEAVYQANGVALIRSQNVYNGRFAMDGLAYLDERHAEQLQGVTVESGDVLLNITGDSVARSCRVPEPIHDWTQNTATQADVRMLILDSLWQSLPRPPLTEGDTEVLADRVYEYVWQRSATDAAAFA